MAIQQLPLLAAIILCGCPVVLFGQLKWDEQLIIVHPSTEDTISTTTFSFINEGNSRVIVLSVRPSCDCTTANSDKKIYAPGERGRITATFTFGDRQGEQNKEIVVTTDGGTQLATTLHLKVMIPYVALVTPSVLSWNFGGDPKPQTAVIKIAPDQQLKITGVDRSSDWAFSELVETVPGREYKLTITPKDTLHEWGVAFDVKTDKPLPPAHPLELVALVHRPAPVRLRSGFNVHPPVPSSQPSSVQRKP